MKTVKFTARLRWGPIDRVLAEFTATFADEGQVNECVAFVKLLHGGDGVMIDAVDEPNPGEILMSRVDDPASFEPSTPMITREEWMNGRDLADVPLDVPEITSDVLARYQQRAAEARLQSQVSMQKMVFGEPEPADVPLDVPVRAPSPRP